MNFSSNPLSSKGSEEVARMMRIPFPWNESVVVPEDVVSVLCQHYKYPL